ncbi:PhzF family phenazine biosynthesis protein [Aliikangiella sp. IMCC44653]
MRLKIYHIDAFTKQVFKGNFAAVILLDEWLTAELMQSIAAENNLSETAFAKKSAVNTYEIRWFSPISEIDFCGHATLATAFVLFKQDPSLKFVTFFAEAVGSLDVKQLENGQIEMSFPNRKPQPVDEIPEALIDGLSIEPKEVLINEQAYFVVYPERQNVLDVTIDENKIKTLAPYDVVVTAVAIDYDFVSRYFWPANGTLEDPVTGSIHAGLAPLWAEKLGKTKLKALQASARGGEILCEVSDDKVSLVGDAVQYLEGYIEV